MNSQPNPTDWSLRPRLRTRGLDISPPDPSTGQFLLFDQYRIAEAHLGLSRLGLMCASLLDGDRDLREVQAEIMRRSGGMLVPLKTLTDLVEALDEALLLENGRFTQRFLELTTSPNRRSSCIGCYSADPDELRQQVRALFTAEDGPGLPGPIGCKVALDGRLRAVLVPHMDYARGGVTYGWGFRELAEHTDARLFVIIATSHYSPERFTLTRQHFQTPLGVVPTDHAFIDRLVGHFGEGLFNDPFAHLPEHSIELEVVLLQYLFEGRAPIRIVPLLVGSFRDCVDQRINPNQRADISRLIEALRQTEADCGEPVCYVISGDLAHIGPKFNDPDPVTDRQLDHSRRQDDALLETAMRADATDYFGFIAEESDARRICGFPPTYTTLEVTKPARGMLLHYDRFVHPRGFESVSFASMAFYD